MDKRILGKDLAVSAVGLGCMGFSHAYGTATEKNEATRLIRGAVEMGYTFFDTAECYVGRFADGTPSNNEELVGEALRPFRDHVVIATKFGVRLETDKIVPPVSDSRPRVIRESAEGSLKRLGVDRIDLYYQHRIDPNVPPEEVAVVMADLMKEGKIRYWGVSEADETYLRRAHVVCPVTAIQNRYSMMARYHESLFSVLEELNIGFVAYSPMANGFLSGKYGQDSTFEPITDYRSVMPQYSSEGIERNQKLLEMLQNIAQKKDATPAQISLAWMLCKKPWIVPIPGSSKADRIEENFRAGEIILTKDEVDELDKELESIPMSEVFGGTKREKPSEN
ncbi:MAG: aldo/keto reductase [Deltaproteobacteria bacterium]|jgi:aryl-alcohol dehydrogenase-like predicted oxidoreductase|nr:aldo/keto reductase [Deltaproteobacteria bacterium]